MQIKNPTDPASPQQVSFLQSLLADRVVEAKWAQVAQQRIESGLTKGEASKMIEWFKSQPQAVFKDMPRGVYSCSDGNVYVVRTSKTTGRPYAMLWDTSSNKYIFDRSYYRIVRNNGVPLALDKAAAMGVSSGYCIVCGAALSDEKSLKAGIGPVCAKSQAALVGAP